MERDNSEDTGVDGSIVFKTDLQYNGIACTGFLWLRLGTQVADCCECGNEPSVSIKFGNFDEVLTPLLHEVSQSVNQSASQLYTAAPQHLPSQ